MTASLLRQLALTVTLCFVSLSSFASPSLKDYGALPEIQMMAISPNGGLIAYRKVTLEQDRIVIYSFAEKKALAAIDVTAIQPNGIYFINNEQLILRVSTMTRVSGFRGRFEVSTAYAYDIKTGSTRQLLIPGDGPIYRGQSGLGSVVGLSPDGDYAYMPAFVGEDRVESPAYSLLKISLKKKRPPKVFSKGHNATSDFFLNRKGEVLARESYDNKKNLHTIEKYQNGKWIDIFKEETPYRSKEFVGLTSDFKALVMLETDEKTERRAFYNLALSDGTITGPLYVRPDADIDNVISDFQRVVYGVRYQSFIPSYEFFDKKLDQRVKDIQAQFPDHSVNLVDWTPDWKHIIFNIEGSDFPSDYLLFSEGKAPTRLASSRPQVTADDLHPIGKVNFKARDGLLIPTLLTIPKGQVSTLKNLPAVIMPHGGPESHDTIGFDWEAQALANQGYLVIQPQFRGSDGFGLSHILAGRGEWGKKMQDDLTDTVNFFVHQEMIDPTRVCIAGGSYGGYAALAGGAFTPSLYKCVVSINGIGNINDMLASDKREHGKDSWIVSYMEEQFTQGEGGKAAMKAISPEEFADKFTAPVLLIHATADKRVPFAQSKQMFKALKKAKKEVELVELKGESHSLQEGTTRLQSLTEMVTFINKHIGTAKK